MIDKTTTVPKGKLGKRLGRFGEDDVLRLNQDKAMLVFLALAVWPRAKL